MRRRITIALVGLVAAALALTAVGTYVLARVDARERTRHDAEELAAALGTLVQQATRQQDLRGVARALRLDDAAIVPVRAGVPIGLPAGVHVDDLRQPGIRLGLVVSGSHGDLVWAARATRARNGALLVVVTKKVQVLPSSASRWFLVASIATLALAFVVGALLARSLTGRLRATESVARRISDGDLSARVPDVDGDDEVATLGRSVNDMAANLQDARDVQRHFLLTVSHDLRTPLTSIRGYAEAIADGAADDDARAADIIVGESQRLERLVEDLLELAKLDTARLSLHLVDADVGEIASDSVDAFRPAARDAGVILDVHVAGRTVATVDPDRLGQALANLVENALKHATSRIDVDVARDEVDGRVRVVVTDDGAGIASDDLPRIFEPLYVGTRTPRRQVGSGLGLAIVQQLVTAMGGTVTASNREPSGARFEVVLPSAGG